MPMSASSAILFLPMKKKWFDLVRSGKKKEEYRLFKPYWQTRIRNWIIYNSIENQNPVSKWPGFGNEFLVRLKDGIKSLPIVFFNGYQKDARKFKAYCSRIEIRVTAFHPEWGEGEYDGKPHFVFHIGHIDSKE